MSEKLPPGVVPAIRNGFKRVLNLIIVMEKRLIAKLGNLDTLSTRDKTTIVGAINEISNDKLTASTSEMRMEHFRNMPVANTVVVDGKRGILYEYSNVENKVRDDIPSKIVYNTRIGEYTTIDLSKYITGHEPDDFHKYPPASDWRIVSDNALLKNATQLSFRYTTDEYGNAIARPILTIDGSVVASGALRISTARWHSNVLTIYIQNNKTTDVQRYLDELVVELSDNNTFKVKHPSGYMGNVTLSNVSVNGAHIPAKSRNRVRIFNTDININGDLTTNTPREFRASKNDVQVNGDLFVGSLDPSVSQYIKYIEINHGGKTYRRDIAAEVKKLISNIEKPTNDYLDSLNLAVIDNDNKLHAYVDMGGALPRFDVFEVAITSVNLAALAKTFGFRRTDGTTRSTISINDTYLASSKLFSLEVDNHNLRNVSDKLANQTGDIELRIHNLAEVSKRSFNILPIVTGVQVVRAIMNLLNPEFTTINGKQVLLLKSIAPIGKVQYIKIKMGSRVNIGEFEALNSNVIIDYDDNSVLTTDVRVNPDKLTHVTNIAVKNIKTTKRRFLHGAICTVMVNGVEYSRRIWEF